jgi:hypothetical protein
MRGKIMFGLVVAVMTASPPALANEISCRKATEAWGKAIKSVSAALDRLDSCQGVHPDASLCSEEEGGKYKAMSAVSIAESIASRECSRK